MNLRHVSGPVIAFMFLFLILIFFFLPDVIAPKITKEAVQIALADEKVKELLSKLGTYSTVYRAQITGTDEICDSHVCTMVVININGGIPAYYVVVDMNEKRVIRIQTAKGEIIR